MNSRNIKRLETWDRLIDHLVIVFYYRFRQQLKLPFDSLDNEPVIKFGGFVLEEPWIGEKGKVRVRCVVDITENHIAVWANSLFLPVIFT